MSDARMAARRSSHPVRPAIVAWLFAFRCRDQLGTALYPIPSLIEDGMMLSTIDPLIAAGVVLATAATDAVYVMFTSAVVARHRLSAATWSSIWYLLSSFAVIHYIENWLYVAFAAAGSWIGAFVSLSFLNRPARPLR